MNFFRITSNARQNAKMSPDYVIFKVNCREGVQILSDIGHLFGVRWPLQCREYSPFHAKTREFWLSQKSFSIFVENLHECLNEYTLRAIPRGFKQPITKWHECFNDFLASGAYEKVLSCLPLTADVQDQDLFYLLTVKKLQLSDEEVQRLKLIEATKGVIYERRNFIQ